MKHINVALFVPDLGCPHRCSFCNQKTISGKQNPISVADIEKAVETALSTADCNEGEIAFFGGSFTAIDKGYMLELLKKANEYVSRGLFRGIRISTRPDCINEEILDILSSYGVTSIELGCQSMDDEVLIMNNRGHTSDSVVRAAQLIKDYGFEFGVQMMTGLYGSEDSDSLETARRIVAMKPDTVRIYPTVVIKGTRLHELMLTGEFEPKGIDETVELCSEIIPMFENAGIRIIRVGLHSGGGVEGDFAGGAYHPALRELCEGRIYYDIALGKLREKDSGRYLLAVNEKEISKMTGQKKQNLIKLQSLGYDCSVEGRADMLKYEVAVIHKG